MISTLTYKLPEWLQLAISQAAIPERISSIEAGMELAINLACKNVSESTGGPFGAVVAETETGRIVSVAVNSVVEQNSSLLHGEIFALMLAQQQVKSFSLGEPTKHMLFTSAQPCIQCFGSLFWTGLDVLICGATTADVEEFTGFKEGPLPGEWKLDLEEAGITVFQNIMREKALVPLQNYKGRIYNGTA
jgi:tRNA(Arg) A34 adenosine deaminase TadA